MTAVKSSLKATGAGSVIVGPPAIVYENIDAISSFDYLSTTILVSSVVTYLAILFLVYWCYLLTKRLHELTNPPNVVFGVGPPPPPPPSGYR
jgi:hypothetical protein